jgi:hypothetical protein
MAREGRLVIRFLGCLRVLRLRVRFIVG